MKTIKILSSHIEEEINDAKSYGMLAVENKDEHPELASVYYKLAEDELVHVGRLHDAVVSEIRAYREEHGDPPDNMMAVYEYLHERHIECEAEARAILAQYRR